ncbi:DUF4397 domain-containing protein [Nocardioides sp. Leaf374]|uniref:DUF4397 domain-containing protein n=1 Tax=Nocardioides sp. Leaf374 TaxID=2876560 RepID=UPI001E4BDDAC|nr:DUF4397 domain-containing protein [Nocardioides sp. Leaf374]
MSPHRRPRTARTSRTAPARTVLATLALGAVAATTLAPSATAAPSTAGNGPAAQAPATTGWLRLGHLSPGTGDADVRVLPLDDGSRLNLTDVPYGEVSDFQRLPAGRYRIAFREAGQPLSAKPMVARLVEVDPGSAATVVATGRGESLRTEVIDDDLTPPPAGQAKVRLVSGVGDNGPVSAAVVGGPVIAEDVATGGSTPYANVAAQTWQVDVASGSDMPTTGKVAVKAGGVYTLLVVDGADGGVEIKALQDSGSAATMPSGGVDTGAGGLAPTAGAPTDLTAPAAGVLAALAALGGLVLLRRGRATA